MNDLLPLVQMRRAGPDVELFDDPLVQAFFVKHQRHFVDPFDVFRGDHRVFSDVTEMGDFVFDFLVEDSDRCGRAGYRAEYPSRSAL